jgi:hypothetical protein
MNATGIDPKAIHETWEKAASAWFDVWLRSPAVLSAMGKTLEAQLGWKSGADEALANVLEAWKVPSSRDLEAMGSRIRELEERVAKLEERDA